MKKIALIIISILFLAACSSTQGPSTKDNNAQLANANLTNAEVSTALKLTLKSGVQEGHKNLKQQRSLFSLGKSDTTAADISKIISTMYKFDHIDLVNELDKILNRDAAGILNTAEPIFNHAIDQMSIGDAYRVLMSAENGATKYFKDHASPEIKKQLQPQINKILNNTGANQKWDEILKVYNEVTGQNVSIDLSSYLADDIMREMFNEIAAQEVKMRLNDYLRTTLILQEVYKLQDGVKLPGATRL